MTKQIITTAIIGMGLLSLGACNSNTFKKTKHGLEYRIVKDEDGKTAKVGDVVDLYLVDMVSDSEMFNTRKEKGKPIQVQIVAPSGNYGDIMEGLVLMSKGDSAVFRYSLDSIRKKIPNFPTWIKAGAKEEYRIKLVAIKSMEQAKAEQQAEMMEQQKKMQESNAKQAGIDDQILQQYFTKNNLKPTKTASGLYYTIEKPGSGANPVAGQEVTMNYTGKTLDGKPFDSNVDPQFKHVEPFKFFIGRGMVIPGWDEGVALLKKGAKGKLYIPSPLAYGQQGPPQIGANAILMFDVEVVNIADAPQSNQQQPANR